MKVVFLFQGTTHYYNLVLSKLNTLPEIDLVDVVPTQPQNLGDGVYQTRAGINFTVYDLDEYQTVYRSFFFRGLWKILLRERPQIVVTTKVYLRGFFYHLPTALLMRILGVKLILKDHPFRLATYRDRKRQILSELHKTVRRWRNFPIRHFLTSLYHSLLLEEERWLCRSCDALVCYIDEAYRLFGSYGVDRSRIFITYNSPDTDLLFSIRAKLEQQRPPIQRHPYRIIHVGRLVPWKRVDLLIRAFLNLLNRYPSADLLIVGSGPQEKTLKHLAVSLGISSRVRFLGGIYDYHILGEWLLSCAVYVLAGMGGISINDAMCFGLPIVCSVGDGTEKNLVRHGYNGLYFAEGNVNDLEAKISQMLSNPRRRARMGEHSTVLIKNTINIHTVINGYLKAFHYVQSH